MLIVSIVHFQMELVKIMNETIITKFMYHIDEFNINSFCPHTLKIVGKEQNKFLLFKKLLNVFHKNESIYEESVTEYTSFIMYSVIIDALKNDKNILTYESYLYNVLKGFSTNLNGVPIHSRVLAKIWTNLINIFSILTELSKNPAIKNISINKEILFNLKHINVDKMNNNYYMEIPIVLEYEDKVDIILILPSYDKNIYSNIAVHSSINYFGKHLNDVHLIELSMNKFSYEYSSIKMNHRLLQQFNSFKDSLYIDFNKINIHNCNQCPLDCNAREILQTRYSVMPYNPKAKTIKVRN